ncbi:MAG TPA: urate hydroxylase PuuD [Steroidobacteraceae bacterium]
MKIFTNHRASLVTGIILALLLGWGLHVALSDPQGSYTFNAQTFGRWLHIGAGIFWIGILYYFNAVQVPAQADATADKGGPGPAAIGKYIAPRALFWFRWSAAATWIVGAWLLEEIGPKGFINAFTLSLLLPALDFKLFVIGIGAWLGTIMLFNVWGLIWPNQKKILGIKPATDEEKAKARKVALYASRTNFILSFPMLLCMIAAGHGLPF